MLQHCWWTDHMKYLVLILKIGFVKGQYKQWLSKSHETTVITPMENDLLHRTPTYHDSMPLIPRILLSLFYLLSFVPSFQGKRGPSVIMTLETLFFFLYSRLVTIFHFTIRFDLSSNYATRFGHICIKLSLSRMFVSFSKIMFVFD